MSASTSPKHIEFKVKYINPCVTDRCIEEFIKGNNEHCLATIEIEGENDWAYFYGKKCNQLKTNKLYSVKASHRRYGKILPLYVFTSNYKHPNAPLIKSRKELKEYLNSKEYNKLKQQN